MSYNIDTIHVLSGQLSLRAADARKLVRDESGPEDCFIEDLEDIVHGDEVPKIIDLDMNNFRWRGEGSGNSWEEYFLPDVVPLLRGEAELVVVWEGGDSFGGIRIKNGKATEHEVVHSLGKKLK